jgi:hypothetical protein
VNERVVWRRLIDPALIPPHPSEGPSAVLPSPPQPAPADCAADPPWDVDEHGRVVKAKPWVPTLPRVPARMVGSATTAADAGPEVWRFPFGQYQDKTLAEIHAADRGYLQWIANTHRYGHPRIRKMVISFLNTKGRR